MTEAIMQYSCEAFTEALASQAPVPGGGGAAALMGALAAALCRMAGALTTGKKKYAVYEEDLQRLLAESEELRRCFLDLIQEDAAAFEPLSRAYALPKDDPSAQAVLRNASIAAARAPYEMMEQCCRAIDLLAEMREKCSVLMISDVGCGAAAAKAALEAAALNVFINTKSLPEDPEARTLAEGARELLSLGCPRAQAIIDSVFAALGGKENG